MNWHYKIIEHKDYAELVEFMPNLAQELWEEGELKEKPDNPHGQTESLFVGEDKADIHRQLLQMLQDTL